jgi:hypothetical protein
LSAGSHTRRGVRLTTAVLALFILVTGTAQAVPRAPRGYGKAIEGYAGFQPQQTCSPTAKPGVADFSKRVLAAYKGTRSLGIVRACKVGGSSEHKEGRAWDWGVSAYDASDRARVGDLMGWLLATDRYGNKHAIARRLGIQYVIWNKRIWGSYAASSGWRKYTGPNPHTDHVHFSFTWAGANRQTSFWTGKVGGPTPPSPPKPKTAHKPTPTPKPEPLLPEPTRPKTLLSGPALNDETVALPATSTSGVTTKGALIRGQKYLLEVSGTYTYAKAAGSTADAECSAAYRSAWRRDRSVRSEQPSKDHLDMYVNGVDLDALADTDTGSGCDTASHTYRWTYVPDRNGRAVLRLWDPTTHADNSGALKVRVIRYVRRADMRWTVPASVPTGMTSPGALEVGVAYVATISGTYSSGGGTSADAECSANAGTGWRRERADGTGRDRDHLDAMLEQKNVDADPLVHTPGTDRCDVTTHTYRHVFTAQETRPLNVRVFDHTYKDNSGGLSVRLTKVTQATGAETVAVDTRAPATFSDRIYPAGQSLLVRVSGRYVPRPSFTADAECSRTTTDAIWRPWRGALRDGTGRWLGDMTVFGRFSAWKPVRPRRVKDACDPDSEYVLTVTPSMSGPLVLSVVDDNYTDNSGTLKITVTPR